MPFSVVSEKSGKTYYLHQRHLELKGGREVTIYFFGPKEGAIDALSEGYEVSEGMKLPDGDALSITPMGQTANRLRRYRKDDPDFEGAITAFAEADASEHDPLEGEAIGLPKDPVAREQFRKLLAGG